MIVESVARKINFRIILVEPEFPVNIGAVARVMANFGFDKLYLVNPKGFTSSEDRMTAYMFAKHARSILDNACIVDELELAVKGSSLIIGTTGVPSRYEKRFRVSRPVSAVLKNIARLIEAESVNSIALVFGRESRGLDENEFSLCDEFAYIPTSGDYPVMNLSHAVAILLYELSRLNGRIRDVRTRHENASYEDKKALLEIYDSLVECVSDRLFFPAKVKQSFHNLIGRAIISKKEARALTGLFSETVKLLKSLKTSKK